MKKNMRPRPVYALIDNDRSDGEEMSYTLLMVHDLGEQVGEKRMMGHKVRAVIDKSIHYVQHVWDTAREALVSTSLEVSDHKGFRLSIENLELRVARYQLEKAPEAIRAKPAAAAPDLLRQAGQLSAANAQFRSLIKRSLIAFQDLDKSPKLRTELSAALAHDETTA